MSDRILTALPGQTAVVTGAGSGIGRAVALALAEAGMTIVLVGRDRTKLEAVARDMPGQHRIVAADITTSDGIAAVRAAAGLELAVLVNSAGYYHRAPIASTDPTILRAAYELNALAPLQLAMACLEPLERCRGQVVALNSTAILAPSSGGLAAYTMSKHALRAGIDSLRQEVNGRGIRVLSVFPGRTNTPMQSAILAAEGRAVDADCLLSAEDVATMVVAALQLPRTAEVTDIIMRPMRPMPPLPTR